MRGGMGGVYLYTVQFINLFDMKFVIFKPLGYFGVVLGLLGILGPTLLHVQSSPVKFGGVILSIVGLYIAFKNIDKNSQKV
jgi:hypothetical protein